MLVSLPGYEFVVPDDVISEITDTAQRSALEAALSAAHLRRETITDPEELTRYAEQSAESCGRALSAFFG